MLERDVGLRLDGIVSGVRSQLDWLAHVAKDNLSDDEFREILQHVGTAMGAIYEISAHIYRQHPDAVPPELKPPLPIP